jgi:hypothetical protein
MSDNVILGTGDLRARVLRPRNNRYTRTRFNHSGFISDVWYKNVPYTRYERSQKGGSTTEGCGLCCEYVCTEIERDTNPGDPYLKFGVGILKRTERLWSIGDHPEYEPLSTEFECDGENAFFHTISPNVGGYAYEETREVFVRGDEIEQRVSLKNIGDKSFTIQEYCHNFTTLGENDISPDYVITTPSLANTHLLGSDGVLTGIVGGFKITAEPDRAFYLKTSDTVESEVAWTLSHKSSSCRLSELVSFKPVQVAVWGHYYVISIEVFHGISLNTQETACWTRKWRFQ